MRTAAFRFLCDCLAGGPTRPADGIAWSTVIALAHAYRVAPAVLPCLGEPTLTALMPTDAAAFFRSAAAHRRRENARIRDQALAIAASLNRIGVTPVFLKGGAHLLAGLYPDIALRVMVDLDILVPAAHSDACAEALQAEGYRPSTPDTHPEAHHGPALGRPDQPVFVELHHQVLAYPHNDVLPAEEMLEKAVPLDRQGVQLAVAPPDLAVAHTIAHAQLGHRDALYGRFDLRGLLDLTLLSRTHGDTLDWPLIARRFAEAGKRHAFDTHLLSAHDLLGIPWPVPTPPNRLARTLYRRALARAPEPHRIDRHFRRLRPLLLLRRELSQPPLRRRLARNMTNRTWWTRHWRMLVGR